MVIDLLTPVQQTDLADFLPVSALFAEGFDHTSVVMVTGPTGPSSRFASRERMAVVRIGDGATATVGVTLAAADAGEFVQRWRTS
jgi:hypothetical protein